MPIIRDNENYAVQDEQYAYCPYCRRWYNKNQIKFNRFSNREICPSGHFVTKNS